MLLDMPVYLCKYVLESLFQTLLNESRVVYLLLNAIQNIFRPYLSSTSSPSTFEVISVNTLYKLLTYFLTFFINVF